MRFLQRNTLGVKLENRRGLGRKGESVAKNDLGMSAENSQ